MTNLPRYPVVQLTSSNSFSFGFGTPG